MFDEKEVEIFGRYQIWRDKSKQCSDKDEKVYTFIEFKSYGTGEGTSCTPCDCCGNCNS